MHEAALGWSVPTGRLVDEIPSGDAKASQLIRVRHVIPREARPRLPGGG